MEVGAKACGLCEACRTVKGRDRFVYLFPEEIYFHISVVRYI